MSVDSERIAFLESELAKARRALDAAEETLMNIEQSDPREWSSRNRKRAKIGRTRIKNILSGS